MTLHLRPGQIGGRSLHSDRKRRKIVTVLVPQPVRRTFFPAMLGHVLLHPALAVRISIPLLEGGVNVGLGDLPHRYRGRNRGRTPWDMNGRGLRLRGRCDLLQFLRGKVAALVNERPDMCGHFLIFDVPHGTVHISPAQTQLCGNKIAVPSAAVCQSDKAAVLVVVPAPEVFIPEKLSDLLIRAPLLELSIDPLLSALRAPVIHQDFIEVHVGDAVGGRGRGRCLIRRGNRRRTWRFHARSFLDDFFV